MKKIQLLALLVLPLFSSYTQANEDCTYFTFGLGADFSNKNVTSSGNSHGVLYAPTIPGTSLFEFPNVQWKNNFKTGFDVNFAYGYRFAENFRGEIEAIYQRFNRKMSGSFDFLEIDAATTNTFARTDNISLAASSGHVSLYSLMTNAIIDFSYDCNWKPFLGAGFGFAWIHAKSTSGSNTLTLGSFSTTPTVESSPTLTGSSFALQFKAGISYAFSECYTAILQYRLLGTARFMTKSSRIHTHPGQTGDAIFTVPDSSISGLVNSMLDICILFG